MSWFAMALGGVFGSLSGGYALTNLSINTIFLLFSVLPFVQLFSCNLVDENSIGNNKVQPGSADSKTSNGVNGKSGPLDGENFSEKKSNLGISRRKKSQKDNKERVVSESKIGGSDSWLQSLKAATYSLFSAFKKPIIFR